MADIKEPKQVSATEEKSSLSEAERFLESLNLPDAQNQELDGTPITETDSKDIMSFLDEISNYPTEDPLAKPQETKRDSTAPSVAAPVTEAPKTQQPPEGSWMSWGNSFWNQASAAVKTTTEQINRTVASETASKLLEDRVKTLQNLVNKENIEKLGTGLKQLTTTILETVTPPISEHELVEVWLTHNMEGYTGLEALVYRSFSKVMDYTETGQVVVRNTNGEDKAAAKESSPEHRNLNISESVSEATKSAKAKLDELIKKHYNPENLEKESYDPQSGAVPVIQCPVFMAIQPVKITLTPIDEEDKDVQQLSFLVFLVDPKNKLKFKSYSQSMSLSWLDIPYEENEWVEDKMVDIIRMSITSIAQDYIWTRMSGSTQASSTEAKQTSEI